MINSILSSSSSSISRRRLFSSASVSSILTTSLRFQHNNSEAKIVQEKSLFETLTFPEAFSRFHADDEIQKSSINTIGSVMPHLAQRKISKNSNSVPIRAWVEGIPIDREALVQLEQLSSMKDIIKHPLAVMPDVHTAMAATVGTVIPTTKAIIPAAAGVDLGCGIFAARTSLKEEDLPNDLEMLRMAIELAVPHGRTHNGDPNNDAGGWRNSVPRNVARVWKQHLEPEFKKLCVIRPELERTNNANHLSSLGSGNHFIELSVDEETRGVWICVHSGSRGVGNKIGSMFIEQAKKDMGTLIQNLPNADLAYFKEGTKHFDDYIWAVEWAQNYAHWNRYLMIENVVESLRATKRLPPFTVNMDFGNKSNSDEVVVDCHHNYISKQSIVVNRETGEREEVFLTRKGATSAKKGELAIIPGSMGARSFIVRGKGNEDSYCSCSHGAGRKYSRGESTRRFTLDDHALATEGVACRKDSGVLDETPAAYKNIDDVMNAQRDCVEIVYTLKQKVCVKG